MTTPYAFGMSQDDAATEFRALDLGRGDSVVCIASAGEVPLNLAALGDVRVDAVDNCLPQLHLARLKLMAASHLDPPDAARFLGYREATASQRQRFLRQLDPVLDDIERTFWSARPTILHRGPIHAGRFERYIARFSGIGLRILGRKRFWKLFELDDRRAREEYFDHHLASGLLKAVFRTAFHPRVYRGRGMVDEALVHSGNRDVAGFFFSRFRDFCTATPPRDNYFLQITFFRHVQFDHCLPEFLSGTGPSRLRAGADRVTFHNATLTRFLHDATRRQYDGFALSNVGDWLSRDEFAELLGLVASRSAPGARVLLRYIHLDHPIPDSLRERVLPVPGIREDLEHADRYPFYSLSPMCIGS